MNYKSYFENARIASQKIIQPAVVDAVLIAIAELTIAKTDFLLQENRKDLLRMDPSDPKRDRLLLTAERIAGIAAEISNVATMASPLGQILSERVMPNGLTIVKTRVPLGVVGVIYEARPNVTFDVFSLCFKTGNSCVLKGGSDAWYSNQAITGLIEQVLAQHEIDTHWLTLLPADRMAADALLNATGYIDVLIPRGSQQLINYVRDNSKVPLIETGAGIVHTYFDESGDLQKGRDIVLNAKTRRVSVCNALDCLIVNRQRLQDLPALVAPLEAKQVEIYADEAAYGALSGHYPRGLLNLASPAHFGTEFLSLKLAVKTAGSLQDALSHIAQYGSKHSEAIISESAQNIETFFTRVDAAAVYANASTAFTDGAQFGLGTEIGISTQKLHARGPVGLEGLTSYKWLVRGSGQVRT